MISLFLLLMMFLLVLTLLLMLLFLIFMLLFTVRGQGRTLKGFFHGSADARVLRKFNLCSSPEQSQFLRFLRSEVSKVDFILNNLSQYYPSMIRNRFVWIICYSGVGF